MISRGQAERIREDLEHVGLLSDGIERAIRKALRATAAMCAHPGPPEDDVMRRVKFDAEQACDSGDKEKSSAALQKFDDLTRLYAERVKEKQFLVEAAEKARIGFAVEARKAIFGLIKECGEKSNRLAERHLKGMPIVSAGVALEFREYHDRATRAAGILYHTALALPDELCDRCQERGFMSYIAFDLRTAVKAAVDSKMRVAGAA